MRSAETPKLTVALPTRERSDTLLHSLKTLVNQDYEDCEILVSDNFSQDNTKEVVESFSDSRIRYINTGRRISMSENWEFALRHVLGEFVTYLGDDDGFIPGGIKGAMQVLEKSQTSALIWNSANYYWPTHVNENLRNRIRIRVGDNQVHVVEGRRLLRRLTRFRSVSEYTCLPGPYTGIVRKSLFDQVTALSTDGVFFKGIAPDIFSAIALSLVAGKYLLSERPFSVSGTSGHSTGNSYASHSTTKHDSPFAKFASELSIEYDDRVKLTRSFASVVMGEYLLVRESFPGLGVPDPDWDRYLQALIREARTSLYSDEILQSAAYTAKKIGRDIKVPDRVKADRIWQPTVGIRADILSFTVPPEMVNNIYDACQLIAGMLPASRDADSKAPVSRFVGNIRDSLIAEAKTLYRSY
jgi:glycosyltransferase involved in cell wall biosynthesis